MKKVLIMVISIILVGIFFYNIFLFDSFESNDDHTNIDYGDIDYINFLKINDIMYIKYNAQPTGVSIDFDDRLLLGKIQKKLDGSYHEINYESQNLDSAYLEVGTPIYALKDYKDSFRIAIINPYNKLQLYESFSNPNAEYGTDYFDLSKLVKIKLFKLSGQNKSHLWIEDKTELDQMIQIIDSSGMALSSHGDRLSLIYIEFHFVDGSISTRAYDYKGRHLQPGLRIKKEIDDVILKYIDEL